MLDNIENMGADNAQDEEELVEKLRSEIHSEAQATDEEKNRGHCVNDHRRWSKKKDGKC